MPNVYDTKPFADKRRLSLKKTEVLTSLVVIGASGAITSQSSYKDSGMLVTKTAAKTGRYTINVNSQYKSLVRRYAAIQIGDDAAATAADGNDFAWRDNDIGIGAKDGTIELQCMRSDTSADANPTSGTILEITLEVEVAV